MADPNQVRDQQQKKWSLWMLEKHQEDEGEVPPTEITQLPEELCCPICYEEYKRPNRKPITLFPCGHAICENCLHEYERSTSNRKCCICNKQYSKTAVNFSLLQVIDNAPNLGIGKTTITSNNSTNYQKELQIATSRLQLLSQQLNIVLKRSQALESEINTQQLVMDHLDAELKIVQEQHAIQKEKMDNLIQEQSSLNDEEQQLRGIIVPLLTEVEKLKLLSEVQETDS